MDTWDIGRYDAFFLDADGVLVRDRQPIDGATEAFGRLRRIGRVLILTNNSTRSRQQHASVLSDLGFDVSPDEIVASAYVAARHLQQTYGCVLAWPIGEQGLIDELLACDHRLAARPEEADWVVAGMDRAIDYRKLADGLRALGHGARLLATNEDGTYPTPDGPMPGAGSIVGAFRGMGFEPEISLGKPSPALYETALNLTRVPRSRVLMIGDRLETDIEGAIRCRFDSLLVLTGISRREDIAPSGIDPTWVADSLSAAVDGRVSPRQDTAE